MTLGRAQPGRMQPGGVTAGPPAPHRLDSTSSAPTLSGSSAAAGMISQTAAPSLTGATL